MKQICFESFLSQHFYETTPFSLFAMTKETPLFATKPVRLLLTLNRIACLIQTRLDKRSNIIMTMISNREYYFVLSVFVHFFISTSTYVIENVAYAISSPSSWPTHSPTADICDSVDASRTVEAIWWQLWCFNCFCGTDVSCTDYYNLCKVE